MSDMHVPETDEARGLFVEGLLDFWGAAGTLRNREAASIEFDRFIAKVKADALREAAAKLRDGIGSCNTGCHVSDMMTLQSLADRMEEEA